MERQEFIRDYLNKSLHPSEQKEFEIALQQDSVLREEVAMYSDLQAVINSQERASLKKSLQFLEQKKSKRRPIVVGIIATIVSIIVLISVFLIWDTRPEPQELYTTYFDIYPNNLRPTAKGDVSIEAQPFLEYERGDYESAANGFLVLLENGLQPDLQFYYTMSILNTGKSDDEALMQLTSLEGREIKYLPQVLWYSGLLYLKKEQLDSATVQFKKLLEHPALYKNREVEKLLEKID